MSIDADQLRVRAISSLGACFPEVDATLIEQAPAPIALAAGEVLCRAGEHADRAWLLLDGRLKVFRDGDDRRERPSVVGEIRPGGLVGERGLLQGAVRDATVVVHRSSLLIPLDIAWFAEAIAESPSILTSLVGSIAEREERGDDGGHVLVLVPTVATADVVAGLAEHAAATGSVVIESGEIAVDELEARISTLEREHERLVLVAETGWTESTARACSLADSVAVVIDVARATELDVAEEHLGARSDDTATGLRNVVFVHPRSTTIPTGTESLLAVRPGVRHFHLRRDDDPHRARVMRLLQGRGVALVLGGGGGRALAEIGVFAELWRQGVPVDAVVGTSGGAAIGAAIAQDVPPDQVLAHAEEGFTGVRDHTLPVVSVMKGRRLWDNLSARFGTRRIEDLWLPFGCMTTNLTAGRPEPLTTGEVRLAVRASVAIPGVFPPVDHAGDLLVDGGVFDNLPVSLVDDIAPGSFCIAVDVAPPHGLSAPAAPIAVSGGAIVRGRMLRRPIDEPPSLGTTITQSMVVSAAQARAEAIAGADLHLDLDMTDFRLFDFDRTEEIAAAGSTRSRSAIEHWLATDGAEYATGVPTEAESEDRLEFERTTRRATFGALWLAVVDLRHRLRRFVVAVVAATFTLTLLLLITGVVNQFDREPGATTDALGGSHWVVTDGIENPFTSNASFAPAVADAIEAAGATGHLALARLPLTVGGEAIDAVLVGHDESGPGAPEPDRGRRAAAAGEVAVASAVDSSVGDDILLGSTPVEVVGEVDDTTLFAGMPLVFVPIEEARRLVGAEDTPFVSAVLLDGPPDTVPDGLHVLTSSDVAEAAKGPIERPILTLHILQVLLAVVAALIIGAVVYLASVERSRDVAVLRAIGVNASMLAIGVATQALLMALVAALAAIALQTALAPVFPLQVHLTARDFVALPVVAIVIAMLASYASIRRTLRVDPVEAFAGAGG